MAKIGVHHEEAGQGFDGYPVASCELQGSATSSWASPQGYSLWLLRSEVAAGSVLSWSGPHGDEVLYVRSGRIIAGDQPCLAGGMVIIERNALATISVPEQAVLLHFGSTGTVDSRTGGGVHVVGAKGMYALEDPTHVSRIFADGTCDSCSVHMLFSSRTTKYRSAAHSHTQDEIIHLLDGEISLGSYHLGPGDSVGIPADLRYRFESGPAGYAFLNFSPAKSEYVPAPGEVRNAAAESHLTPTGENSYYVRT
jgi:hypothetical protein